MKPTGKPKKLSAPKTRKAKPKEKITWFPQDLLVKALRKIWMRSPMRAMALAFALVDSKVPVRSRLYRCCECKGEFLLQQVDVDHKIELPKGASWDQRLSQQTLGIRKIVQKSDGSLWTDEGILVESIVKEQLQVLCIHCHKAKTASEKNVRKFLHG